MFMVFVDLKMFFYNFLMLGQDMEVFDSALKVFCEYSQGHLTMKALSLECFVSHGIF